MKRLLVLLAAISIFGGIHIARAASDVSLYGPSTLYSGLVGWWTFDGANMITNVADSSGNGYNGNLQGFTSTSSAILPGRSGQALSFNGSTQYVTLGTPAALNAMATFSISAWIYPTAGGSYIAKDQNSPYDWREFYDAVNQEACLWIAYTTSSAQVCSSFGSVKLNRWSHVVVTWDGNGSTDANAIIVYVNGTQSTSGAGGTGTRLGQNAALIFGARCPGVCGTPEFWGGTLDDARIYNRVLSAQEVYQAYNTTGGGKADTSQIGPANLNSGLVGWWTFDGKDTNWTTGITNDRSGNGNNGSLISMSTTTSSVAGKIGQALNFNGTNQYANIGTNIASLQPGGNFSVIGWFKSTASGQQQIFSSYSQNTNPAGFILGIDVDASTLHRLGLLVGKNTGGVINTDYTTLYGTSNVDDGRWHQGVGVWDGSLMYIYVDGVLQSSVSWSGAPGYAATNYVHVGNHQTNASTNLAYFNGSIDDVRVYNRALSAQEVYRLYSATGGDKKDVSTVGPQNLNSGLVGWWTFDGKNLINNVADSSGTGNTGRMVGATTTVQGMIGQALSFDGSTQYVTVGNDASLNPAALTNCIWAYPTAVPHAYNTFMQKITDASNYSGFFITSAQKMAVYIARSGNGIQIDPGAAVIPLNKWSFVCFTYSSGTGAIGYINGVQDSSAAPTATGALSGNTAVGRIGSDSFTAGREFTGRLDDARIYNRALSAQEIYQLYKMSR